MPTQSNWTDSARAIVAPPVPKATFTVHPKVYSGPRAEDVLQQRQQHLSAGQYHFYRVPLMLVEASMQYCFDDKGKVYVDGYSNVCHVGHCHPHFVASCQAAMSNIISNTRYLHPTIGKYAEKLKSKLPSSLSVCYFVNSGSEANDLAIRLARIHTQRRGVICLEHAYHGTTATCTGASTSLSTGTTKGTADYNYCARDIHVATLPDPYRGKYRGSDPHAGEKYADDVLRIIEDKQDIAAFIHESVQGVGGQIVYPKDYLKRAYAHVRRHGGITIADEVQTGFGRTGTHFWAFEAQDVVPDIVVMGKPIGNGFPLGAVVCTREVARSFDGVQYFNTNGGNPVACAAGLAVLEIIERDHLQKNALEVSVVFMRELRKLKEKHEMIGDVRGVGMFVGIELVRDRKTQEPAAKETADVMERCRHFGLLVGKGGYHNNVIRLKPPLCFTVEDAKFAVKTLDTVLTEVQTHSTSESGRRLYRTGADSADPEVYINCASPAARDKPYHNDSENDSEDNGIISINGGNVQTSTRVNSRSSRGQRQSSRRDYSDSDDSDDEQARRRSRVRTSTSNASSNTPRNIPRHLAEQVDRHSTGRRSALKPQSRVSRQQSDSDSDYESSRKRVRGRRSPSTSEDESYRRSNGDGRRSFGNARFALPPP